MRYGSMPICTSRYRTRGIISVECTQDEVTGQCGFDSYLGSFVIADFTHQDDVRVLS